MTTTIKHTKKQNKKIKNKTSDIKPGMYIEYGVEHNDKDPQFKVGDNVRKSKYKNIFAKGYVPNLSKVFFIKKVKSTVPWTYIISNPNCEEIIKIFYEKELQNTSQKEFRIEKVIKTKGDKLYVK